MSATMSMRGGNGSKSSPETGSMDVLRLSTRVSKTPVVGTSAPIIRRGTIRSTAFAERPRMA